MVVDLSHVAVTHSPIFETKTKKVITRRMTKTFNENNIKYLIHIQLSNNCKWQNIIDNWSSIEKTVEVGWYKM